MVGDWLQHLRSKPEMVESQLNFVSCFEDVWTFNQQHRLDVQGWSCKQHGQLLPMPDRNGPNGHGRITTMTRGGWQRHSSSGQADFYCFFALWTYPYPLFDDGLLAFVLACPLVYLLACLFTCLRVCFLNCCVVCLCVCLFCLYAWVGVGEQHPT